MCPEAESRPCCSISHFMTTFINFPESGEGDKKNRCTQFPDGETNFGSTS